MLDFDDRRGAWSRLRIPSLAIAGVAVVIGWLVFNPPGALDSPDEAASAPRSTTEVRTADLRQSFEAEGSLVFLEDRSILHPTAGTVTSIASPLTSVSSGDTLYTVDNVPTVALIGQTPAWRTMSVDASGQDVLQLEEALVELGYNEAGLLAVDGTFSSYTADLVRLWQADLDVEETGLVEFGSVVFVGADTEVGSVNAVVGQPVPPDGMLDLRSPSRVVTFSVADADLDSVEVGDTVNALLPDRTSFDVMVTDLGPSGDGLWTVSGDPVGLSPEMAPADEVPLEISWDVSIGDDVIVVPASAIKRLDSGDYVVEVVRSSERDEVLDTNSLDTDSVETEFIAVEIGEQSGSLVEIRSELELGTRIISP